MQGWSKSAHCLKSLESGRVATPVATINDLMTQGDAEVGAAPAVLEPALTRAWTWSELRIVDISTVTPFPCDDDLAGLADPRSPQQARTPGNICTSTATSLCALAACSGHAHIGRSAATLDTSRASGRHLLRAPPIHAHRGLGGFDPPSPRCSLERSRLSPNPSAQRRAVLPLQSRSRSAALFVRANAQALLGRAPLKSRCSRSHQAAGRPHRLRRNPAARRPFQTPVGLALGRNRTRPADDDTWKHSRPSNGPMPTGPARTDL